MQQVQLEVQADFLDKLANARPVQAIAELIWNALDAEATDVRVEFDRDAADILQKIRVRDNGHGIPLADAPEYFKNLGGSWKRRQKRTPGENRVLHGQEGQGRFRALALGRVVDWVVTVPNGDADEFTTFTIEIVRDRAQQAVISDPRPAAPGVSRGVEVVISELFKHWRLEDDTSALNELTEMVALYLTNYRDVSLSIGGIKIDPADQISARATHELTPMAAEGNPAASLDIIEWKSDRDRALYLCTEDGFPLVRLPANVVAPGFSFVAYLRSSFISKLNAENTVDFAEMFPELNATIDEARSVLRDHFRTRSSDRVKDLVDNWKSEDVYPYREEPRSVVEQVEREVFDVVATSVATALPDMQRIEQRARRFQLRMLRQAIERGPEELQLIITEVLHLSRRKQIELAKLLRRTSLSKIISAAKLVADRLEFLDGLSAMLFTPELKRHFKERRELHRILEKNTWIFGEEYHLTVSDRDLSEVLRKCRAHGGLETGLIDDEPVSRPEGGPEGRRRGIADLVMSRRVPTSFPGELHHLVVELKAPKNPLSGKDTQQIKSYAYAVAEDERFRNLKATWSFWLVGNDLSSHVRNELRTTEGAGVLQRIPEMPLTIRVKSWAELISEARSRLEFIQLKLNFEVNRPEALAQMRATYAAILGTTVSADDEGVADSDADGDTIVLDEEDDASVH